jgi:hypothetical protein
LRHEEGVFAWTFAARRSLAIRSPAQRFGYSNFAQ